jgi:hypothetical protein
MGKSAVPRHSSRSSSRVTSGTFLDRVSEPCHTALLRFGQRSCSRSNGKEVSVHGVRLVDHS